MAHSRCVTKFGSLAVRLSSCCIMRSGFLT
jgi:hypothetical protein